MRSGKRASVRNSWSLVLFACVAALGVLWHGLFLPRRGTVVAEGITLVASDRDDLACAISQPVAGLACEYEAGRDGQLERNPGRSRPLAPYVTTDGRLYLIPELFSLPALRERLGQEPPERIPREHQRRFVAKCRLRVLDEAERVKVRWSPRDAWHSEEGAWIAEPIECRVHD